MVPLIYKIKLFPFPRHFIYLGSNACSMRAGTGATVLEWNKDNRLDQL